MVQNRQGQLVVTRVQPDTGVVQGGNAVELPAGLSPEVIVRFGSMSAEVLDVTLAELTTP